MLLVVHIYSFNATAHFHLTNALRYALFIAWAGPYLTFGNLVSTMPNNRPDPTCESIPSHYFPYWYFRSTFTLHIARKHIDT